MHVRHLSLFALIGVLLVAFSGCTVPDTYVSLGDSYTAGPGIPRPQQTTPLGCLRSDHNYPTLAYPSTGLARFKDPSCSGAKTKDMFAAQDVTPGPANPPQLYAVDGSSRIVTLGIGGNDIGFTSIAESCGNPLTQPCKRTYVHGGRDELQERIDATKPEVAAVLAAIHQRGPNADVLVVGYPAILPEAPTTPGTPEGCYPLVPILPGDVAYLRQVVKSLNAMLASVAAANDATYVDTYASSIGHDVCKPRGTKWVEGVAPTDFAAPVHPNALGMANTSRVVAEAIRVALAG